MRIGNCITCHSARGTPCRRARHRHALRHGLRRQTSRRRRHRPGPLERRALLARHAPRPLLRRAACSTRLPYPDFAHHETRQRRICFYLRSLTLRQPNSAARAGLPMTRSSRWRCGALFFRPGVPDRTWAAKASGNRVCLPGKVRPAIARPAMAGGAATCSPRRGRYVAGRCSGSRCVWAMRRRSTAPDQAGVADWPLDDIVMPQRRRHASARRQCSARWPTWSTAACSICARRRPARHRGIPRRRCRSRPARASRKPRPTRRMEAGAKLSRQTLQRLPWRTARARAAGGSTIAPALAGNRLVNMEPPVNLIRVIVHGGFAAAHGNPRPSACRPSASRAPTRRSPRWTATCAAAGAMRPAR